jgi:alcohol dehydrogenase (NADP+)
MCLVGLPDAPVAISPFAIITNRRSFSGSMIGGMAETQGMLDYCAEHNIVSDIELTSFDKLAGAYDRVVKGDVKYRFVIDMATLPKG